MLIRIAISRMIDASLWGREQSELADLNDDGDLGAGAANPAHGCAKPTAWCWY